MTDQANSISYDRSSLVQALQAANQGNRLGTQQIRALIEARDKNWELVSVELITAFYELGYSDEHKELFNGSFRSMLRNALRTYGTFGVKVSYKRTREYENGDRELPADDSGSWYWHVDILITPRVKSDEDHQAVTKSSEVVGEPVEITETERVLNKVLETEGVDRVEATAVLLGSLSETAAAFVVAKYLEQQEISTIREIRKKAEPAQQAEAEPLQATG